MHTGLKPGRRALEGSNRETGGKGGGGSRDSKFPLPSPVGVEAKAANCDGDWHLGQTGALPLGVNIFYLGHALLELLTRHGFLSTIDCQTESQLQARQPPDITAIPLSQVGCSSS